MTPIPRRWRRVALIAAPLVAAVVAGGLVTVQAHAEDAPELIQNGGFDNGSGPWWSYGTPAPAAVVGGQFCADVPGGLTNRWDAGLGQNDLTLQGGATYTFQFDARTSAAVGINANVQLSVDPFTTFQGASPILGTDLTHYSYTFSVDSTVSSVQVAFQVGGSANAYSICIDNVSLAGGSVSGSEQLTNGTFDDGTNSWWWTGNAPSSVVDGQLCTPIPGGTVNPWDAIIGQNDIHLANGVSYALSFDARGTRDVGVTVNVQQPDPPFGQQLSVRPILGSDLQHYTYSFTSDVDMANAQLVFQVGGSADPWTLCIDNVSLKGGVAPPVYTPDTGPRVRVNQVGYLPKGPKNATIVTTATDPVAWSLKNSAGTVVASGNATPRGIDTASGQNVQSVDFSSFQTAGTGYTLVADGETSFPFDISGSIYQQLRSDAISFFYAQRSGVAIDNAILPGYGRPAGHAGVAPNMGDTDVPCQAGVCDYRLDVSGGWYDAGDHGKYVVNGGIAVYQLLAEFERTKNAITATGGPAAGDSTLRLPERGNGVPDVLDEARWELDFLLKMQVPAGQPLAGMAHHKIHDQNWTGLPLAPDKDPQPRELHPPSTAATLNLAATAAQAARLFAPYDHAFSGRSLAAAKAAYAAAKAHPAMYASSSDGNGGGTYDDTNVTDEFYWAAAELFITTGEKAYLDDINASPLKSANVFTADGFGWQGVAALGRLDLATVPNLLPAADRAAARASVVTAADGYLGTIAGQAYGLPYAPTGNNYVWGSNSSVLNNMVVLGSAFDLTGAAKYRDGVLQGMDYLLGRNALNHSFITGYGEVDAKNQHTRIFAHSLDPALPQPPNGSLAGGPNTALQDPLAAKMLKGCVGQFCYIDDIQSYSTNEVAINWNSALSWVAAFAADQGAGQAVPPGTCKVSYVKTPDIAGHFIAAVTVTNTGTTAINGWTVNWAFTGDQKLLGGVNAAVSQTGATVTARNLSFNKKINPKKSETFLVLGTSALANPTPGLFTLNGKACT